MNAHKLSISLPKQQFKFLEKYQIQHHYKTKSEVIRDALQLLQQAQLENSYLEANKEINNEFDNTSLDGLIVGY